MPYKKKRKNYKKKSTNKNRRINAVVMAKEINTHDYAFAGNIDSILQGVLPLTEIAQGTQSVQRIGLKINPISMEYKLLTTIDLGTDTSLVRMIIFKDTQNNGVYPTINELLEDISPNVMSWKEHDTRPRFHIYRDELINMNNLTTTQCYIKGFIKFSSKLLIEYKGTGALQSSNSTNAIFCFLITDEVGGYLPYVNFKTRLRYYD